MSHAIHLELELPDDLARLRLPEGVQQRLMELLDKQDQAGYGDNVDRRGATRGRRTGRPSGGHFVTDRRQLLVGPPIFIPFWP